jgi:hypothetical protein
VVRCRLQSQAAGATSAASRCYDDRPKGYEGVLKLLAGEVGTTVRWSFSSGLAKMQTVDDTAAREKRAQAPHARRGKLGGRCLDPLRRGGT